MSREFVDAIETGNNLDAEKAFNDSVTKKVGDALELKRKDITKSLVSNYIEQETDVNEE